MMKLAPRLFLGLGEMGLMTVEAIAHSVRHLYARLDQSAVTYLNLLSGSAPSRVPAWVLQAQVCDMLKHVQAQPEWLSWLDATYYRDSARQNVSQERQLMRGLFLYELARDGGPYPLLQAQARQLATTPSTQGMTLVYVFGALDEMFTRACLVDVANLVQRAFRSASDSAANMRLIVYLALPQEDAELLVQAQAFAALRELERYATPSGQADNPVLYAVGSGLEAFNAYASRMIDMLRAYPYQDNLPTLWADVVLAQLDPETFSANFVQTEVVNYPAREMLLRQRLEDPYALVSGAYFVQVFSLPLIEVRQRCQRALMEQSLARCLGTTCDEQQQALLQTWIKGALAKQGQRLNVPRLLGWLYEPFDKPNLSLEETLALLYVADTANDPVLADARRLRALQLEWWPQTDSQPNQGLGSHLLRLMRDYFGADFDPQAQDTGHYPLALAAVSQLQVAHLKQAWNSFVEHVLASHGVQPLAVLLRETLRPRVRERLRLVQSWVVLQEKRAKEARWLRDLEIAASTLGSTRNFLGRVTQEAQVFINRCQHAAEALKLLHATRQLERLCQACDSYLQALESALQRWQNVINARSLSAAPEPVMTAPHRLLLVDEAWQARQEALILEARLPAFSDRLAWRWQLNPDSDEGALSLTWDGQALPDDPVLLGRRLEQASDEALRDVSLRLWDDLLVSPDLRQKALKVMRGQLSAAPSWSGQRQAQIVIHHLLLGDWRDQEGYGELAQALRQAVEEVDNRGLYEHGPLHDPSRLVYLRIDEALPLHNLPEVQRLRASYQRQFNDAQPRLHVLAPEVQAVRLEARLSQQGQQVLFNSQLVSLLHHVERVRLFVYAEALGVIQSHYMIDQRERYALILDEQHIWDMGEGGGRLYAIVQFCLAELPIGLQQALRQLWPQGDLLRQAIEWAIVSEAAARAEADQPLDGPHTSTVRLLQTSPLHATDARRVGQEAQALWEYLRARQDEAAQSQRRITRELALLLARVARDLYDEKNRWLNNRLL
ncbi:MAG: hypothetical protein RML73_07900 [Anaerolineae bacterium]|nr:hypothetical protein [Anaerolineae bacterium]